MRSRAQTRALALFTAALALGTAAGCGKPEEDPKKKGAPQEIKAKAVETMKLSPRPFEEVFIFPGKTTPLETRTISAESGGRVLAAPFEENTRIKRGALMLRVDTRTTSAQIGVLKAQQKSAEAQLRSARRELSRTRKLSKDGLATPQQLDQAISGVEIASRGVDQAKAAIKQARVGQSMGTVRSPVSGHVITKMVRKGEFVGPGAPVARIIEYSTLKVEVTVPESAVPYIKEGEEVDIHFPALNDRKVKGVIKKRGVTVVQPTQTFPVEIHIQNEKLELLPGMRTRVVIPRRKLASALVVPRDALLEGVSRKEAMVLNGDKAALRVVKIGPTREGDVVITEGLKAGDELIVQGHRSIVDGSLVRVVRQRQEGSK